MQDHTSPSSLDNAIALQKYGVGQPVRRKEDDTLVRGKGKYTDDFTLPGQAYCWMVRSSHAHGIIKGIDTAAAKAMPGVLGVWTGKDLEAAGYNPFTCGLPLKSRDGSPLLQTNRPALPTDKVRFVGDPVAFVVAETLAQARDAAEAVEVDIEPLPAVTDAAEATKPGAPQLYDHIPSNVALDYHYGDTAKIDAAFATAAHVTKLDIVNTRVAVVSMEPRVAQDPQAYPEEYNSLLERSTSASKMLSAVDCDQALLRNLAQRLALGEDQPLVLRARDPEVGV